MYSSNHNDVKDEHERKRWMLPCQVCLRLWYHADMSLRLSSYLTDQVSKKPSLTSYRN
jgi:hypothetical protein